MQSYSNQTTKGADNVIVAPPKSKEQMLFELQTPMEIVDSWLTMLDSTTDPDKILDKLLQDGTARAMREEAQPKSKEQTLFELQTPMEIVDSWLTMLDSTTDPNEILDKLLQDGTARAMREEEIEVAKEKKLHDGDSLDEAMRSLDLLLQDSVPNDRTVTGGRQPSNTAGGLAMRRPNVYLDFAVKGSLVGYEIRTRRTPLKLSEPMSPTSQGP